jgi:hypothetical protein
VEAGLNEENELYIYYHDYEKSLVKAKEGSLTRGKYN